MYLLSSCLHLRGSSDRLGSNDWTLRESMASLLRIKAGQIGWTTTHGPTDAPYARFMQLLARGFLGPSAVSVAPETETKT